MGEGRGDSGWYRGGCRRATGRGADDEGGVDGVGPSVVDEGVHPLLPLPSCPVLYRLGEGATGVPREVSFPALRGGRKFVKKSSRMCDSVQLDSRCFDGDLRESSPPTSQPPRRFPWCPSPFSISSRTTGGRVSRDEVPERELSVESLDVDLESSTLHSGVRGWGDGRRLGTRKESGFSLGPR